MNPMDMLKNLASNGGNPQQFIMQTFIGKNTNPMVNNLVNMAKSGKTEDVENFAKNLFKEQGRDFDKEFSSFMKQIKG